MRAYLPRYWSAVLARGIAATAFGLIVLFLPGLTLLTLVFLFAGFVLIEGVAALISGLSPPEGAQRSWGLVALGAIAIIAGIAALVWPQITGLILILLIGFWAIAVGIVQIFEGVRLRQEIANEWLLILTGIVALFFGLIVVVNPGAGALALSFFIGFFALVYGVLQIILAFRLRSALETGRP